MTISLKTKNATYYDQVEVNSVIIGNLYIYIYI